MEKEHQPHITANISSEEKVKEARKVAIDEGKSLRQWAGEVIEERLDLIRKDHKTGPNLSSAPKRTLRGKR